MKNMKIHNNVRYRKLKTIIKEAASIYGISLGNYNLEDITAYKTVGSTFAGKADNVPSGYTPFVRNNHYEVFEIPHFKNYKHSREIGEFLILLYCPGSNVDEYLFAKMKTSYRNDRLSADFHFIGCFKVKFVSQNAVSLRKFITNGTYDHAYDIPFDSHKEREAAFHNHYGANSFARTSGHCNYFRPVAKHNNVRIH